MITGCPQNAEGIARELIGALDEELALLDERRRQLSRLFQMVLDRDYDRIDSLLAEIEQLQDDQAKVDTRVREVRTRLAEALGVDFEQTRLSRLAERLPHEQAGQIAFRREQIVTRAQQLQQENFQVAVLLCETRRINRELLRAFTPGTSGMREYGADGAERMHAARGLVDAER